MKSRRKKNWITVTYNASPKGAGIATMTQLCNLLFSVIYTITISQHFANIASKSI